jgi:hypothetical protein
MDPVTAMAISGGISALSNLGGGVISAGGAAAQNAAARERNQNEMAMFNRQNDLNQWYFQKQFENELYLSGSAYQRSMADMKAAGLNPILAYSQGGAGGHAGSGQSAGGNLSDPAPANPGAEMGRGISRSVSSALDAATAIQQLKTADVQNANTAANTAKTTVDTDRSRAEIVNTMANTDLTKGQTQMLDTTKGQIIANTVNAYAGADAHSASAVANRAQARRTGIAADKEQVHGYGVPADLSDQAEKLTRRVTGSITGLGAGAPPRSSPSLNKHQRPFTGLRNE